jgi:hypothetical protein
MRSGRTTSVRTTSEWVALRHVDVKEHIEVWCKSNKRYERSFAEVETNTSERSERKNEMQEWFNQSEVSLLRELRLNEECTVRHDLPLARLSSVDY